MFNRIWEENKKFIQIVGAGGLVFLILQWFAFSIEGSGQEILDNDIPNQQRRISSSLKKLDGHLDRERKDQPILKEKAKSLSLTLGLGDLKSLGRKGEDLELRFAQDWRDIYNKAHSKAEEKGIDLVKKTAIRFPQGQSRDTQAMETKLRMLQVVERLLAAVVDSGVPRVTAIKPGVAAEVGSVANNPEDQGMIYYPVDVQVEGRYADVTAFLKRAQQSQEFIQVELRSLAPRKDGRLTGEMTVRGLVFGKLPVNATGRKRTTSGRSLRPPAGRSLRDRR